MLLVTLIIVLLAALVGGEFAAAIPSDSTFSSAITTMTDNAGTAFTIFGVSLLAIPAVAVLAYIVGRLGGFMNLGSVRGRMRR
jgi:cell division protein FtsX